MDEEEEASSAASAAAAAAAAAYQFLIYTQLLQVPQIFQQWKDQKEDEAETTRIVKPVPKRPLAGPGGGPKPPPSTSSVTWPPAMLTLQQQSDSLLLENKAEMSSSSSFKGQFGFVDWSHLSYLSSPLGDRWPPSVPPPASSEPNRRRPVVIVSRETESVVDEDEEINVVGGVEEEQQQVEDTASSAVLAASLDGNAAPAAANLEVAACDGPVRFHRVVNPSKDDGLVESSDDESAAGAASPSGSSSDVVYQCLFCNHVFKSHYCYQKHKRRHLNPFLADFHQVASDKKSLILKDINVQFFPCKVCGAKFPSYYFVHKHKKLWHDDEDETAAAGDKAKQSSSQGKERQASPDVDPPPGSRSEQRHSEASLLF